MFAESDYPTSSSRGIPIDKANEREEIKAPSTGTYGAGNVTTAAAQVQTASGAIYSQSNLGSMGTFSVVLTSVSSASANGGTAYFLHGSATVTLMGQSGAPGTATISATF